MKTFKIYLAPYVDKVVHTCLNSNGDPFISKRYVTVPSKKNQQQAIVSKSTGETFIKQSEQYIKWKKLVYPMFDAEFSKMNQAGVQLPITRAKIKIIFYFETELPRDLTNKSESIMDALRDTKIIIDDMYQVTNNIQLNGFLCKDRPRTEIYIHIIEPDSDEFNFDKTNYDKLKEHKNKQRVLLMNWKNS